MIYLFLTNFPPLHLSAAAENCDIVKLRANIPPVLNSQQYAGASRILHYLVTGKFFYHLTGKCDFTPARLEAKIRRYIEHTETESFSNVCS